MIFTKKPIPLLYDDLILTIYVVHLKKKEQFVGRIFPSKLIHSIEELGKRYFSTSVLVANIKNSFHKKYLEIIFQI